MEVMNNLQERSSEEFRKTRSRRFKDAIKWAFTHDLYEDVKSKIMSKSAYSSNAGPMHITDFERLHPKEYVRENYTRVKKPFYKKSLFKNTVKWAGMISWRAAVLGTALGGVYLDKMAKNNWQSINNEVIRQRANLESFTNSEEFNRYAEAFNGKFIQSLNYAYEHPKDSSNLVSSVQAYEKANDILSWTNEVHPIYSKEDKRDKSKIIQTAIDITRKLSQRDYLDQTERTNLRIKVGEVIAKDLQLYLVIPYVNDENNRKSGVKLSGTEKEIDSHKELVRTWAGFQQILSNKDMQHVLVKKLAKKYGTEYSAADMESAAIAYNILAGPAINPSIHEPKFQDLSISPSIRAFDYSLK